MTFLKKLFIILFFCILFLLAMSLIKKKPMSVKESMLAHMEEKYGETFEFVDEKGGAEAYRSGIRSGLQVIGFRKLILWSHS